MTADIPAGAGPRSAPGLTHERAVELEGLEGSLAELERERGAVLGEAEGLESQRSDVEARRNALEVEVARLSSRVEALRDWEEERAGLETGARELYRARERGEEPVLSAELGGLLADHLHPEKHPGIKRVKDCAAAAVLVASLCALCVALALAVGLLPNLR